MKKTILALVFVAGLTTGCQKLADYNHHFIEGQSFSEKKVQQLQVGQTKDEVLKLLGASLSHTAFEDARWYYITHQKGRTGENSKLLIIEFDKRERVSLIQRSCMK